MTRARILELYPGDFAADEHEILVDQLIQERDELRRSQTELELSRDYYVQLQDYAPVGYCTLDYSGLILAINATAAQILGKPVNRLVGWPLRGVISKLDQRKFVNHLRLCPGQKGCVTTELRLANGVANLGGTAQSGQNRRAPEGARRSGSGIQMCPD
jgi:PAS domain-containing protein